MPKYKEQKFTEDGRPIRKSDFRENRDCYMDTNGDYVYTTEMREGGKWVRKEVARIPFDTMKGDTTWTIYLDDVDCEEDRSDDRYNTLVDPAFRAKQARFNAEETDTEGDEYPDPMDEVVFDMQKGKDVFETLYGDPEPENPMDVKVDDVMEKLTEDQRNMIYDHVGMGKKLEDIRREDEDRTGEKKTQQSYSKRWDKIKKRFGKELGMEVPKIRKGKKTDEDA